MKTWRVVCVFLVWALVVFAGAWIGNFDFQRGPKAESLFWYVVFVGSGIAGLVEMLVAYSKE